MNQVGLVGRITKDPMLKKLSEGRILTSFTLAINRNYRNNEGTVEADFVLCSAWGKLAERIAAYCGKGSLVGVNGRLQTRSYTNKENNRVYSTEVLIDDVRFYVLKTPGNKGSSEKVLSEGAHVAETTATFDFGENQSAANEKSIGSKEILSDFELPHTENVLPIR
ncbi:single-stranded DNA-binding protein [Ureibacillus manganicus]|uniref:single-stranded DNA-binding protein n=1 Tax=Ureibacillus manganicus TaxID=1266064 RepID=UPI0009E0B111|nr:single-stranded DNA-binding protein [Ureibacillus manganicus]